eukprot:g17290.t1
MANQNIDNAAAAVQQALDANGQQLGLIAGAAQGAVGAVQGAVAAMNNANALQHPGGAAFHDQLLPLEIDAFNDASQRIPRKMQIEVESFKNLQILVRDRKLHRAQHLRVKMSFDQHSRVADQNKSKEVCIHPRPFLHYLAVEGRVQAILTPEQAGQLCLVVADKYDECPPAMEKSQDAWRDKIDRAFWNTIIEGERFRADPPPQPAPVAGAPAPAPQPNYNQRMGAWFALQAGVAGGFREQFNAHCRSFQQMVNIFEDSDFMDAYKRSKKGDDSSSSDDSSPGRGRSSMKKKKQKTSSPKGGQPNIKKCCFHHMKGTPCTNDEKKAKNGTYYCDKGGPHAYKTSELSRDDFNRVKTSRLGKQHLKKVDYFSWMKDGEYICKPVVEKKRKDKKEKKRDKSNASSSSSSSSEDEKAQSSEKKQKKKKD